MANHLVAAFIIISIATVHCQWPFVRKWRPKNRFHVNCRTFDMKPVVDRNGEVTKCVSHCDRDHSYEYSFIHGHHCKQLPKGCIVSDCSVCAEGYFRLNDHGNLVCVEYCPEHHEENKGKCEEIPRECNDMECTECKDGYFYWPYPVFYGNRCKRYCPLGYSKNTETKHCERKRLKEGCADILCYSCKPGYYRYNDESSHNKCVSKCPDGYGVVNKRCREIPVGCVFANCSQCKEGFFQYSRGIFFQKCRKGCPSGYFPDQNKKMCVRCSDENCIHCSDAVSRCNECRVPFALMQGETENTTKCVSKCPVGFKLSYTYDWLMFVCEPEEPIFTEAPTKPATTTKRTVTKKQTTSTEAATTSTEAATTSTEAATTSTEAATTSTEAATTSTEAATTSTEATTTSTEATTTIKPKTFPPGCQDEFCLKCTVGYFRLLIIGNGLRCLEKCPVGYYNISNDCILKAVTKPVPLPEGCKDQGCLLPCNDGFYKLYVSGHGSKCVKKCPLGYFTAMKDCITCHEPRCKNCSESPFRCESCKDGFITFKGEINSTVQCVDRCPKGYKRIIKNGTVICEKEPVPECTIENCQLCADHELNSHHVGCVECKAGYLLKRNIFKDECVPVCPDGYYAGEKPGTSISACLDCDVQFCKQCIKRKKCTQCFEPFVFDYKSGSCSLCKFGTYYNKASKSCKPFPKSVSKKKSILF